jgi:transcriptional regulator with XRE-family HTH domain
MPRLRVLRLNAGLSQEDLARAAGVSAGTIKRLEARKGKQPYPSTRRRIAAALGVLIADVDELKGDGDHSAT